MSLFIILALAAIVIFGALKAMTKEERQTVVKATTNSLAVASVYSAKAVKGAVSMSYDAGTVVGTHVSLEQQDTINSIKKFNDDIAKEGGAAKVAIRTANEHANLIGLDEMNQYIAKYKQRLQAELAEAREAE